MGTRSRLFGTSFTWLVWLVWGALLPAGCAGDEPLVAAESPDAAAPGTGGAAGGGGAGAKGGGGAAESGSGGDANGGNNSGGNGGNAGGNGGNAGGNGGNSSEGGVTTSRGELQVALHCSDQNSKTQQISFAVQIGVVYPRPAPGVTLRYWFTADGATRPVAEIDSAPFGKELVKTSFTSLSPPLANADTYLEIGFTDSFLVDSDLTGGSKDANTIQLRIHDQGYQAQLDQTNDYSFDVATCAATALAPHVAAYIDGKLVWGVEPM